MTWSSTSHAYRFGDWLVEPELNRLSRDDEEKRLERRTMEVLVRLLERPGEVLSSQDLLDSVWRNIVVEEGAVHQRISQLRRALGDDARTPSYVENIARRGYRTIAEVTAEPLTQHQDSSVADREWVIDTSRRARASPRFVRLAVMATGVSALLATVLGVWWWTRPSDAPDVSAAPKTVAVLDLRNLTNDSDLDWIAGGLTEELTINVVNTTTAGTLLDETFRGSLDDPLHLQRQLAANVARVFNEGLNVGADYEGPAPEAYAAYLHVLHAGDGGDVDELVYWLERAVAADPTWAAGWARLSLRYAQLYQYFGDREFADGARSALANVQALYGDQPLSGLCWSAWFFTTAFVDGNLEAVLPAVADAARDGFYYPIVLMMLNAGLFREAEAPLRYGTTLTPNHSPFWELRAYTAYYLGDRRTALIAAERVSTLNSEDSGVSESTRAQVFAVAGRLDEARRQLTRVYARYSGAVSGTLRQRLRELPLNQFRLAYAAGDTERALSAADWMEHHGQPARAGLYRLLIGAERADELIRQGIEQGPEYLSTFWCTDRVFVPAEMSEHPAITALEVAMGYGPAWRLELCEYLATLPPGTHIGCEPEAYRLPEG